jgi:Putative zinc-finger
VNGRREPSECAATAERLPELALGILSGSERADVLAHLDRCASCRAELESWAATADVLPSLLGEAEPPAGFEGRTMERLRTEQALEPRWPMWRRVLTVAAIVAMAMIVTLATVRIIDAGSNGSSGPVAETEMTSATMIGRSGHRAGDAFMTGGDERYVFVDVDYGVGSGRYDIEAVDHANNITRIGAVDVKEGHGAWAGELPKGAADPQTVRMVGADGKVFCWAKFGPVAA